MALLEASSTPARAASQAPWRRRWMDPETPRRNRLLLRL
ncbi:hypothetical protein CTA2_8129 [Colletotrichum tanaceti]|nr:hypothetical protein CTA2_8129 [Colletotrichum tanaceti]